MTQHQFEFEYFIKEYGSIEMELDASQDYEEKELAALEEIRDQYPDIEDIKITGVKVIG